MMPRDSTPSSSRYHTAAPARYDEGRRGVGGEGALFAGVDAGVSVAAAADGAPCGGTSRPWVPACRVVALAVAPKPGPSATISATATLRDGELCVVCGVGAGACCVGVGVGCVGVGFGGVGFGGCVGSGGVVVGGCVGVDTGGCGGEAAVRDESSWTDRSGEGLIGEEVDERRESAALLVGETNTGEAADALGVAAPPLVAAADAVRDGGGVARAYARRVAGGYACRSFFVSGPSLPMAAAFSLCISRSSSRHAVRSPSRRWCDAATRSAIQHR